VSSVGNALRNNPFSPYVPCHRVIASNHFVGGFFGEWGQDHKTGTRYNEKVEILSQEGIRFSDKGRLLSPDEVLWKPQSCAA
jgi:methylated-DNA-[protein]-cysteine S-methyltransferase